VPDIQNQIRVFNMAFQVAWERAIEGKRAGPGVAEKLGAQVSKQIKAGARDPEVIGRVAYEAIFGPS
jgi:hypothetical protein